MNRVANWEPVVSKFKTRLSKWKANSLSIAGRLTLIKSVLDSLPSYYFSLFKAPKKVISDLEGLMRRFLWGGTEDMRKMSWVSWEVVTKRIKDGGLGIAPLKINNNALLVKWLWRYLNEPNAMWRRVVLSIHGSSRSWGIAPCNNAIPGVWKNCVSLWNKHKVKGVGLNGVLRGRVGNGLQIRFWLDNWLGQEPLKVTYPSLFAIEKCKRALVADRLKQTGGMRLMCWDWSRSPATAEELLDKQMLEDRLHLVNLEDKEDGWVWDHGSSADFEVASVKKWLRGPVSSESHVGFKWSSWVPNKCNIFMWRAYLDRLPTKMALARRNIFIDNLFCDWCESSEESIEHVLTGCVISSGVWSAISAWCNIPRSFVFHVKDLVDIHELSGAVGIKKVVLHGVIIIACWRLWRARNDKVFDNKVPKVEDLVADIKSLGFLWYKSRFKSGVVVDWDRWCMFDVM
ncbi:putative reverse transcriptase zinc-binding domain-containing protein [Helianthus annuus]|uniref:Reverse transcriptase zinc-binding domain-containing protein n=1 Tax=Helianthus annuus TaxID=4232 RepID=A0A9K3DVT8_HELAN|nr:putative reverse transcriptase zinc-binding domain-containing protein [Helianthus annuus]KAJ0444356.1 putative reverse transcriptase zinc-binding domain-containing protein [Helianthus annuus]